jgi:hypothetical protein
MTRLREGTMLWFLIFGRRRVVEDRGAIADATCPSCRRSVEYRYIAEHSELRFFRAPARPSTTSHSLRCPSCEHEIELSDDMVRATSTMSADRTRWHAGMMSDEDHEAALSTFWESLGTSSAPSARLPACAHDTNPDRQSTGWLPDPSGRHELRYHDGSWWTVYVLDDGKTSSDDSLTPRAPGWYPDPELRHDQRFWDGRTWTEPADSA